MVLSGEMAFISFHIPFTSINPMTEGALKYLVSIGFCYQFDTRRTVEITGTTIVDLPKDHCSCEAR